MTLKEIILPITRAHHDYADFFHEDCAEAIAKAIRDAGYIQRDELVKDEAIERATRAAAEADEQVWDGPPRTGGGTMTLEETIEAASAASDSATIAKAIRDAGYIQRDELVKDEAIQKACEALAAFVNCEAKRMPIYEANIGMMKAAIQAAIGEGDE